MDDPTDNTVPYLAEQLNRLGAAIGPVHRLTALYDGQTASAGSVKPLPADAGAVPLADHERKQSEGGKPETNRRKQSL